MSPDADEMAVAPMDGFVQTTALYMLQVAIEAEATAFLLPRHEPRGVGILPYRRGARQRAGWRNGYAPQDVHTEAGLVQLAVPRLRAPRGTVSVRGGRPAGRL